MRPIPQHTQNLQKRASDPASSIWVSANAGSGKTHVLSQRVVRLLLRGVPPAKILCLTFTKAAAANMAQRVFEILSDWTRLADADLRVAIRACGAPDPSPDELIFARRLFARTVETPGGLKIQTIHAFCEKLLHLFPFEANISARFEVIDDLRQAELLERARRDALAAVAQDQGILGQHLHRLAAETSGFDFETLIREAMGHRMHLRQFALGEMPAALRKALGLPHGTTSVSIKWTMLEDGIAPDRWREIAHFLTQGKTTDKEKAQCFLKAAAAYEACRANHAPPAPDCLASYLAIFFKKDGDPRNGKPVTKDLDKTRPDIGEELAREQRRLIALRALLKAALAFERTEALLAVVDTVFARYERMKAERGLLDFDNLIERTLALLQRSDANWVLYKLDSGIDHILVDEAQDTSEEQWKILEQLTSDFAAGAGARSVHRSFFAVGDDKQSIFSFQGAAPHMFHDMRRAFEKRFTAGEELFEHVRLTQSFRSVPTVLAAVDQVFSRADHQKGLVAQNDVWMIHEAWKTDLPGLVELWEPIGAAS